jgi:hypothetical protein
MAVANLVQPTVELGVQVVVVAAPLYLLVVPLHLDKVLRVVPPLIHPRSMVLVVVVARVLSVEMEHQALLVLEVLV